jgi:hypothetical protein
MNRFLLLFMLAVGFILGLCVAGNTVSVGIMTSLVASIIFALFQQMWLRDQMKRDYARHDALDKGLQLISKDTALLTQYFLHPGYNCTYTGFNPKKGHDGEYHHHHNKRISGYLSNHVDTDYACRIAGKPLKEVNDLMTDYENNVLSAQIKEMLKERYYLLNAPPDPVDRKKNILFQDNSLSLYHRPRRR